MASSSPSQDVSVTTLTITGLLVDIYGLGGLSPTATHVSCLWLHHARSYRKEAMADIARECISAYKSSPHFRSDRGLIALAYDQRNHGSREVDGRANGSWIEGNPTHAQDMFGIVAGMVADQAGLVDALGGYLFRDEDRTIDQHLVLGVSLGGHSAWQALFKDKRVTAGVVIIGCPDYENLLRDRARLSKLSTYAADDAGASFTGSKDFPPALVEACKQSDPKAILFGTSAVPSPGKPSESEERRLRSILDGTVRGKKVLLCFGKDDKLVPYSNSKPFLDWFQDATKTWYADGNVDVEEIIYDGVGHAFTPAMAKDAAKFVVDVVGEEAHTVSGTSSKI